MVVLFVGCQPKPVDRIMDKADELSIVADMDDVEITENNEEHNGSNKSPLEQLAEGIIEGLDFQIGDNIKDVIDTLGQPDYEPFYWTGGEWYNYGSITYITSIGEPIIGYIAFDNDFHIFGLSIGDSVEKIRDVMGNETGTYSLSDKSDPDEPNDELATMGEDEQVLYYISGNYQISFYCGATKLNHGYIRYD